MFSVDFYKPSQKQRKHHLNTIFCAAIMTSLKTKTEYAPEIYRHVMVFLCANFYIFADMKLVSGLN
jgi:hypothetical protein